MTARDVAAALGGRRSGAGYMARCPAHDDRNPSLSIRAADGKLLIHCHAGCSQDRVIDALRARGLWGGDGSASHAADWREWRDGIRYPADWGTPLQEYRYSDADGAYLYSVVRFDPKTFRQGYYDDSGRWLWRKHPRQVLYRLPEVMEAPIVFVVEGEKDVEALREYGFVATTNAGGVNAPWLPEFTEALRGREIIIIPDADLPGRKRAAQIARALLGAAALLSIIELPGAKDPADFFAQGRSELELIALLEREGAHAD